MNELLFAIGLTIVFIGLLLIMVGVLLEGVRASRREEEKGQKQTEYGGVIFIGPIPIVFGSNKNIAKIMLIVAIVIFILFLIMAFIAYL